MNTTHSILSLIAICALLLSSCGSTRDSSNDSSDEVIQRLYSNRRIYTVRPGDTLSEIAQKHYGTAKAWQRIVKANPGLKPKNLQIGQEIILPGINSDLSPTTNTSTQGLSVSGLASFYADKFEGRKTANGETYRRDRLTAAHRTFAFGTIVQVTNAKNNKSVTVRINDRGPFVKGRVIDLSYAAAKQIGIIKDGVAPVIVTPLAK